jgi:hypothetical protein
MSSLRDRIAAKRESIADKSASFERSYKWQNGKTLFRILPGKTNAEEFFEEIGIHWIKDENGKVVCTVGDRQICYGEPCPVRESLEKFLALARENNDDKMLERGKEMLARSRYYANIVVCKAPGDFDPKKSVLAEFPETVWDSMLSQLEDQLEEVEEGADLTKEGPLAFANGVMFVVERSGSGKETRYNVYINNKTVALEPKIMDGALDLASYKRSQFDSRTAKAIAVIGAMIGVDLDEVASKLASPPVNKAKRLAAPKTAKADDLEDDDVPDAEIVELEDDLEDETKAEAEVLSEDDILADLADL